MIIEMYCTEKTDLMTQLVIRRDVYDSRWLVRWWQRTDGSIISRERRPR